MESWYYVAEEDDRIGILESLRKKPLMVGVGTSVLLSAAFNILGDGQSKSLKGVPQVVQALVSAPSSGPSFVQVGDTIVARTYEVTPPEHGRAGIPYINRGKV